MIFEGKGSSPMLESDLYPPLKDYLERQGYEVKGEVHDCDVVAIRHSEQPVLIELKLTLNLTVLLQAIEHLAITDKVYVGIPESCAVLKKRKKKVIKLLKLLNIGLLVIDFTGSRGLVSVLHDPGPYHPKKNKRRKERLLGEFTHRVGDPNTGGSIKRKGLMTVYRQRALIIAQYLNANGPSKASEIAMRTGEVKSHRILYRNVYGWFERQSRGVYTLSPRGISEISEWSIDNIF